jgi:hypothetical protein
MNNILNYFITNPCHFSSLLLSCNIPYTIYSGNSILLFTEIPICIASILYHHKFNINYIKEIDLMCGQLAYWQHMFYAFKYNNYFSIYSYLFCPVLYMGSKYFQYNNKIYETNFIHSFIHYSLSIGTISLNQYYISNNT